MVFACLREVPAAPDADDELPGVDSNLLAVAPVGEFRAWKLWHRCVNMPTLRPRPRRPVAVRIMQFGEAYTYPIETAYALAELGLQKIQAQGDDA